MPPAISAALRLSLDFRTSVLASQCHTHRAPVDPRNLFPFPGLESRPLVAHAGSNKTLPRFLPVALRPAANGFPVAAPTIVRRIGQGTNQNKLRPEDIDLIVSTHRAYKTVEKFAYRATLEEIRENDYNLNIPRYVDTFEEAAVIDLPAVQQEIDDLESQLAAVRTEMRGHLKKLGLAPK